MDVVVERGDARCPRCVAVAEYSFVECGPGVIRYEVRCSRCGEHYREQSSTVAIRFSTDVEPAAYTEPERVHGADGRLVATVHRWWSTVTASVVARVRAAGGLAARR